MEHYHIQYTSSDYDKLCEKIFCNDFYSNAELSRDKYVVMQGLESLWNAKRFVFSLKNRDYEYFTTDIRHLLVKKLQLADTAEAVQKVHTPPGCGRSIKVAIYVFLSLLIHNELVDRKVACEITNDIEKQIYTYGINNSVLECSKKWRCTLDESEIRNSPVFKEAIAELKKQVENLQDEVNVAWEHARERLLRFFPLPNSIFHLGLEGGEILVYAYLMYCEDRKTYKCHPSYSTIGEAVGMSVNTVKKYVEGLESKHLFTTEPTTK